MSSPKLLTDYGFNFNVKENLILERTLLQQDNSKEDLVPHGRGPGNVARRSCEVLEPILRAEQIKRGRAQRNV